MRKDKLVAEVLGEEAAITPSDLYNTEFKNALMGGYDKDEVDEYLERVADVMEGLITQVKELKQQVEEQRSRADAVKDMENTLRNALVSSQKFGDDIAESARREADALLAEARLAKARAEQEAAVLPEELHNEVNRLAAQRDRLRMDMRALLAAHQALLGDIPRAEDLVEEVAQERAANAEVEDVESDPAEFAQDVKPQVSLTDDPADLEEEGNVDDA
jgi:cell division initiation protein